MVSSSDLNEFNEHDEHFTMTASDFLGVFYADATIKRFKYWIVGFFNVYFVWAAASAVYATVSFLDKTSLKTSFLDQALTPNLPFCETPFAMTPYMAQGASAMAHFPYVPLLLLGVFHASPELIPSFTSKNAGKINRLLWIQTALQLFTSVGGHMLPNPRMVLNQEISISIAFAFLYWFFDITTSDKSKWKIDFGAFASVAMLSIVAYLRFGIMPIIFTLFIAAVALSYIIQSAFSLLTAHSRKLLLSIFVPTAIVLAVETVACDWLLTNVSVLLPWHLLFDILFWQVLGSAIDVIIISPVPGRFMLDDTHFHFEKQRCKTD